ncbi:AMP-binding protein [Streptomyces sp. NPDC050529]|uniref:AMP-binding protein n=1 Tax=Streptomyces sp. NPDC050529 TaxID=3365624 RepID=UPI00379D49C5
MRLHEPVADAARRTPHALAVDAPDGRLDYAALDELAGRYAAALTARGVRPGDRVVLWAAKSLHGVALMQGCLRAGVLYVPVSSANPPPRTARIAAACTAVLVVTDEDGAETAADAGNQAPTCVTFRELLAAAEGVPVPEPVTGSPDDAAYILFTSGSTGDPKGVCLSHRNALSFVRWAFEELDIGPHDRLSNHAPFNFDLSVFDLYAAFLAGASVHLVPEHLAYAPAQLMRFVTDHELTVWYSVPSALTLLMTRGGLLDRPAPPSLRVCVFAGEPFPPVPLRQLRGVWPHVRLFNWYGPTETNVCTSHEVRDADLATGRALPIGTACSGDTLHLGDPEPGQRGRELLVAGPTVMLGYWGAPPQQGPYATGDLVEADGEGLLEYLGRRDQMVKIRGNRVELGEIETALGLHPLVREVAVLVVGEGMEARLHAVVVGPEPDAGPDLLELKRWSAQRLPTYMMLDSLSLVDELPRTDNGKTDRRLLRKALLPQHSPS